MNKILKYKTKMIKKKKNIKYNWFIIDAENKILGRLLSICSKIITGKYNVNYTPNIVNNDKVIIFNVKKIIISGKKMKNKIYERYTGYPGGIKKEKLIDLYNKNIISLFKKMIINMLPNNKLRKKYIGNMYLFKENIPNYFKKKNIYYISNI